jgi:SAM-dependent methyltransferase
MPDNQQQAEFWTSRAAPWIAVERDLDHVAGLFTTALFDALAPGAGEHIADIGCGTGRTTVEAARRVAPGGAAVGVDIAEPMVARAQEIAAEENVDNVSFRHADAQVDDLGSAVFDAAFSRFGVMFFADPVAAFANIGRALKPGGRLVFACWKELFENEWMLVPGMSVVEVTGQLPPMPGEGEPGPFSLAEHARIQALLSEAGYVDVRAEAHPRVLRLAADKVEAFVNMASQVGAIGQAFTEITDPETRRRILDALRQAISDRMDAGTASFPAAAWIVTARRP